MLQIFTVLRTQTGADRKVPKCCIRHDMAFTPPCVQLKTYYFRL